MGWQNTRNLGRSIRCCGEQLRYFRKERGLTQEKLASLAGYTDRLVRKAEAGGSVHPDTIEILAQTLTETGLPVFPEDLVISPTQIALAWGQAYREKEGQLAAAYHQYLSEEVEMFVAGDPEEIPFSGNWQTIDGFDRMWQTYFQFFERPDKLLYMPSCVSNGNTAITTAREAVRLKGTEIDTGSWVVMRFEFERGKIVRIEDDFDTAKTQTDFRDAQAQQTQEQQQNQKAQDDTPES